jgi:hypothetical protein
MSWGPVPEGSKTYRDWLRKTECVSTEHHVRGYTHKATWSHAMLEQYAWFNGGQTGAKPKVDWTRPPSTVTAAPKRKGRGICQSKRKSKLMTRLMAVPSSDQALLLEIFATLVSDTVLQGVLDEYDSRNDTSDCEDESDVEDSRHQTGKTQLNRFLVGTKICLSSTHQTT